MSEDFNKIILTDKIIRQITPRHIIYAEISEQGAMGVPGNAMVYLQNGDNDVIFCQASAFEASQQEAYEKFCHKIAQYAKTGEIVHEYGGFGNHCYKGEKIKFIRDDDNSAFIFESEGKQHILRCSCHGVYSYAAAKFVERPVDLDELSALLKKSAAHLDLSELNFMLAYIKRRENYDRSRTYMDKNALRWMSAIDLIRMKHQKIAFLTQEMINNGNYNIQYYKLEYVVNKIGWNRVNKIICEIVAASKRTGEIQSGIIAKAFAEAFDDQDFYNYFSDLKVEPAEIDDIRGYDFCDQFKKLSIIKFTKKQHEKIIDNIRGMSIADLRANANNIAHYLVNYSFQDDTLSYADLFPALIRILNDLPNDDFNQTRTDITFYIAGFILTKILRIAPKTHLDYLKSEYFKVFWHRTGGLEMIKHFEEFAFKDKAQNNMFKDAIVFLTNLDNIQEKNQKYYNYLCASGKKIYEFGDRYLISPQQYMQALAFYIQDIASKNDHHDRKENAAIQHDLYLKSFGQEIAKFKAGKQHNFDLFFATMCEYYPKDRDTMKILFDEFATLDFALDAIINHILLNVNPKIITYALECIVDNIDTLYQTVIKKNDGSTKFLDMYMCACEVTSLEKHLEKLLEIKKFISEQGNCDKNTLNRAYNVAKSNVKKTIFQQEKLAKMQKYSFISLDEFDEKEN